MSEACRSCRFWQHRGIGERSRDPEVGQQGRCRRNAPVRLLTESDGDVRSGALARWPEVWSYDWCGEWKPEEA